MTKPKKFFVRKWLNKAGFHTQGNVMLVVECKPGKYRYVETLCMITDCARTVTLSFDVGLENGKIDAETRNNQAKAHMLADQLSDFAVAFDEAVAWMENNDD